MKIYDITAEISGNLPVYGDERPAITQLASFENGDEFNLMQICATTHIGTHADMPLHFVPGGAGCDTIALEHFYGTAKVMRLAVDSHITKADLKPLNIQAGDIILLDTGQSAYMRQGQFKKDFLALTADAAEYLAAKKIKTLGIDYLSVDPYDAEGFPAHKILLGSGIVVLEGLVLEAVPEGEYTLSALPLKFANGDGSPVRAILLG